MTVCLEMARAAQAARSNHLTEVQARRILSDLLASTGDTLHIQSIRSYLTDWTTGRAAVKAHGTVQRYRYVCHAFLTFLGTKADRPLSSLSPRDIELFRDREAATGKSTNTVSLAIKTIRIPLNRARRQGLILTNPAEAVELLPPSTVIRQPFTSGQIEALLEESDADWRGVILVSAFAGLRLGDASRLKVGNLDLHRRTLRFFPQKDKRSGQRRELEVPLHADLERHFLDAPLGDDPEAPLFPSLVHQRIGGSTGLSAKFRRLMGNAGIVASRLNVQREGKGRRVFDLSFHSLRHSFVSMLANRGVHQELRMKLAGHTTNVHARYSHHDLEVLRRNVAVLPALTHKPTNHEQTKVR